MKVLLLVIFTISFFEFILERDRIDLAFSTAALVLSACKGVIHPASARVICG